MKKLYIAYGSNMNIGQMASRCPTAVLKGTAVLEGWRLRFNGVATIEPWKDASVPVVVWEIGERDEHSSDIYEGFPTYYYKQDFKVSLGKQEVDVFAYIMTMGHSPMMPTEYYFNAVLDGYNANNIDSKPLFDAMMRVREIS